MVYSVTDDSGYYEAMDLYEEILQVKDCDSIPVILCANKCDVNIDQRKVEKDKGKEVLNKWKQSYFYECSAKNNININEIFESLVREVRKAKIKGQENQNTNQNTKEEVKEEKKEEIKEKKKEVVEEKKKGVCILC